MKTKISGAGVRLRWVMRANAVFSSASGLCLLLFASGVGHLTGIEGPLWIRLVGLGLLGFAGLLFAVTRSGIPGPGRALMAGVIAGDLLWVLASAAALAAWGNRLTEAGRVAIAAVAVVVLLFALGQSYYLWLRERGLG